MSITSSKLIGKSEEEVRRGPRATAFAADEVELVSYRWRCDLRFWGRQSERLDILGTLVYFCEQGLPSDILIGQHDALSGRALAHIKLRDKPCYFSLR
jgi:hypothetical protein